MEPGHSILLAVHSAAISSADEANGLRAKLSELDKRFGRAVERIGKLEKELDAARAQIAWFQRQLFGRKAERLPAEQLRQAWIDFCKEQESVATGLEPASALQGAMTSYQLLIDFTNPESPKLDDEKPSKASNPLPETAKVDGEQPIEAPMPTSGNTTENVDGSTPQGPGRPNPKRHKHGRKKIPEELPTIRIFLEPDADEIPEGARPMGAEVSYRLALRRAEIVRMVIVRPRYAVDRDDDNQTTQVIAAEPPDEMIPRGLFAPSGLAHIIAGKFDYHLPWMRLARFWSNDSYQISVSTLSGVSIRVEPYARTLVEAMEEYAHRVAPYLAIDASTARIFRAPGNNRGYAWVRYIEGVCTLFDFAATHDSTTAGQLLDGWGCPTLADGANVYDAKHRETDQPRGGCWAHGRRRLVYAVPDDGRALVGIELINQLFAIEAELLDAEPDVRLAARQARSAPIIAELFKWRDQQLADSSVAPRSGLAKALRYMVNQAERLTYFLKDGRIPIHNNRTELQIRHFALGRKNWISFGSERAAKASGTWLTLIMSAKMHRLVAEAYLRALFRVLPSWPKARVLELAPHRWMETRARLDPAELEQEFGPLKIPPAVLA